MQSEEALLGSNAFIITKFKLSHRKLYQHVKFYVFPYAKPHIAFVKY